MTELISLEKFNEYRSSLWHQGLAVEFGLCAACPKCGKELVGHYREPGTETCVLTSNPPMLTTGCACGWHGYRIA
jgi:hypothetical protein